MADINGAIRIEGWDRAEVKVDAVKHAKTPESLRDLRIEFNVEKDRVSIHTRYAKDKEDNRHSGRVEYRVWVPRQARLDKVSNVNGSIELERLEGEVHASAVNGSLAARNFAGFGSFRSVNGRANVALSKLETENGLTLETVNGQAELLLPAQAKATVSASTLNGRIHSDLDFPIQKGRVGRRLEGQLGGGGPLIRLHAVNGTLSIKQAKATALHAERDK
jgi:hypothetical protein